MTEKRWFRRDYRGRRLEVAVAPTDSLLLITDDGDVLELPDDCVWMKADELIELMTHAGYQEIPSSWVNEDDDDDTEVVVLP